MSLKNQLINYFILNQEAGTNFLYFEELPASKKQANKAKTQVVLQQNTATAEPIETSAPLSIVTKPVDIIAQVSTKLPDLPATPTAPVPINMPNNTQVNITKNILAADIANADNLDTLRQTLINCQNCALAITKTNLVFGEGNPNADIMIIGEAPGADEDMQGQPFVGRAGKLLTDILKAIDLSRQDVYIANICKCRPPNNRRPTTEESTACEPFLLKQIELIKPQFILALGVTAAETLFKKTIKMADIRGQVLEFNGIKTLITYHPAALLRNPN